MGNPHEDLAAAEITLARLEALVAPILSDAASAYRALEATIKQLRAARRQHNAAEVAALLERAQQRLEKLASDEAQHFEAARQHFMAGDGTHQGFLSRLQELVRPGTYGLDDADVYLDRLLPVARAEARDYPKDHLPYVPASVRHVMQAVRLLALGQQDVFWDIGCGLGRVLAVAALASPARVRGLEYQADLCEAARQNLRALRLDAEVVHGDALTYDFGDATAFFLYFPVAGQLHLKLLERLRELGRRQPIRIAALPPSVHLWREPWLVAAPTEPPIMRFDSKWPADD